MARIVVIGAGPMGLAAAYQGVKDGHQVDVVESAPEPGGMAAHFDFGGLSLERFYHFVCKSDQPTFDLLSELGLSELLRWIPTSMGFFFHGRLQPWGNPMSLLRLAGSSLSTKLRYALLAFVSIRRNSWQALNSQSSKEWITRWTGQRGYDQFWRPLFDLKFYEYADDISAAWTWARLRRVGRSRRNLMQEELGYIEGGSKTLVDALVRQIEAGGGRLHFNAGAERITTREGAVTGVTTKQGHFVADDVICTIPTPLVSTLAPDLPDDWKARYDAIKNIGICCVVLKLKRSVSPHFWINISGSRHEIPGIIEFSNLRPVGTNIVYLPFYMPTTNPKFAWSDEKFIDEALDCVSTINPQLDRNDLLDAKVARLRYAQPVCDAHFGSKIPPIQTPIAGLQIADTCFYFPEDRGIAESVKLGRRMAQSVTSACGSQEPTADQKEVVAQTS